MTLQRPSTTARLALLAAVLGACFTWPAPASARLAPTQLRKLLAESELILLVVPEKLTRDQPGAVDGLRSGTADLRVLEVLKGQLAEPTVRIGWGNEVHDQAIDTLLERRIVFLKKGPDGRWTGTHYGRSYWPLAHLRDPRAGKHDFAARVRYPVTMLKMDGLKLVREAVAFDEQTARDRPVPVIFLEDLRQLLRQPR